MSRPQRPNPDTPQVLQQQSAIEALLARNAPAVMIAVLISALVVALVVGTLYFAVFLPEPLSIDPARLGQAGDYFGGLLNPALSFLSVLALLVTLVIQSGELRQSREALRVSQEELKLSREAQVAAASALQSQNKAIQKQSFEQTFFSWLATYRDILGEVKAENEAVGRSALKTLWKRPLSDTLEEYEEHHGGSLADEPSPLIIAMHSVGKRTVTTVDTHDFPEISKAALDTWEELYNSQEYQLDSLFRVLYRLILWIHEHAVLSQEEKWTYVSIVRSQLSWIEMVYLFYNGHTIRGARFKPLIETYALFDNLNLKADRIVEIIAESPPDIDGYKQSAFSSDLAKVALRLRPKGFPQVTDIAQFPDSELPASAPTASPR